MCGICGYVDLHRRPVPEPVHDAMVESLRHRGPDGSGAVHLPGRGDESSGWFGHTRLKIVDLSPAADQPMRSDDGAIVLTYNGEIYNFRELRAELAAAGHTFRSTGDTEVVLRAYEEWGADCLPRLDGMFALAVWDGRSQRLLLARDRTGKKPLYYAAADARLTFGSEIKAVLQAPWVEAEPDTGALGEFLAFGYVIHPGTLYRGVVQVPPGCSVTYGEDGLGSPAPYWDALPERVDATPDSVTIAGLLEHAVTRRLVADVPVGALLSGGLDSSVVVAFMARASAEPVRTFTIGFAEGTGYDERPYARLVAEHLNTDHREFVVTADAVALLDSLLWHHDQPFGDSSAIPTHLVTACAREHVTVALNGDGGDEVFGGYERFTAAAVADRVPHAAARLAARATRLLPRRNGYYDVARRLERFAGPLDRDPLTRYRSWVALASDDVLAELLPGKPEGSRAFDTYYERARHLPVLDRILYANFKTYLPDDLAVKMDRMSMASSLEMRSPFLDTALVEYMARVPAARKVGLRRVKPLLRAAVEPLLPEAIWNRRKHGFGVPLDEWFRGPLGTLFEDEVLAAGARSAAYLDTVALRRLWQADRGQRHAGLFWSLLTLERWLRAPARPAPTPPAAELVTS